MSGDLDALRREVIFSVTETDNYASERLRQVAEVEALIVARWPRSIVVRWRLARELRASVRHIDGRTFAEKRINTIGSGWMAPRRGAR